jgi:hypothetical protein
MYVACVSCKIMESLMTNDILDHMLRNNLLSSMQHGFLAKCCTLTAQLLCYNNWFNTLEMGNWIDVIMLDFSNAFDTVGHNKLLHKLNQYSFGNSKCA